MKRLIASSESRTSDSSYFVYTRSHQRFSVHMFNEGVPDSSHIKFTISELHPYDLAEYAWARVGYRGACYAEFLKNGKKLDGMQFSYYEDDEDSYEDMNEYLNDMLDSVAVELLHINALVEPRIDHT